MVTYALHAVAHSELAAPDSVVHVLELLGAYIIGPFMIG